MMLTLGSPFGVAGLRSHSGCAMSATVGMPNAACTIRENQARARMPPAIQFSMAQFSMAQLIVCQCIPCEDTPQENLTRPLIRSALVPEEQIAFHKRVWQKTRRLRRQGRETRTAANTC